MSWTDGQIESSITFYSSVLVSGAINFATGVKNRRQKPTPVFWRLFLERVSWALLTMFQAILGNLVPNSLAMRVATHVTEISLRNFS